MKLTVAFLIAVGALGVGSASLVFIPGHEGDDPDFPQGASPAVWPSGDVVPWSVLARVSHRSVNGHIEYRLGKAVSALDGQRVTLRGFMVPLYMGSEHFHFLLSASPRTCFECWAPGPGGVVEVVSEVPVEDTFDQILVSGRFSVHENDPRAVLYHLAGARRVTR